MIEIRTQIMLDEAEAVEIKEIVANLLLTNFLTDAQRNAFNKMMKQL